MSNLFSKTARWYDAIYRKADQTGMPETIVTIAAARFGPPRVLPLIVLEGKRESVERFGQQRVRENAVPVPLT